MVKVIGNHDDDFRVVDYLTIIGNSDGWVVDDCRWRSARRRSARRCSGCVRAGARIGARLVSQAILRSTATCMLLI